MHKSEFDDFYKLLHKAAEAFNRELTNAAIDYYFEFLCDFSLLTIRHALRGWAMNANKKFPTAGELYEKSKAVNVSTIEDKKLKIVDQDSAYLLKQLEIKYSKTLENVANGVLSFDELTKIRSDIACLEIQIKNTGFK